MYKKGVIGLYWGAFFGLWLCALLGACTELRPGTTGPIRMFLLYLAAITASVENLVRNGWAVDRREKTRWIVLTVLFSLVVGVLLFGRLYYYGCLDFLFSAP